MNAGALEFVATGALATVHPVTVKRACRFGFRRGVLVDMGHQLQHPQHANVQGAVNAAEVRLVARNQRNP